MYRPEAEASMGQGKDGGVRGKATTYNASHNGPIGLAGGPGGICGFMFSRVVEVGGALGEGNNVDCQTRACRIRFTTTLADDWGVTTDGGPPGEKKTPTIALTPVSRSRAPLSPLLPPSGPMPRCL